MSIDTIFYLVMALFFIGSSLYVYSKKRSASQTVNKKIKKAQKMEERNNWSSATEEYKSALSIVIGIPPNDSWNVFELKENIGDNGWFILQKLDRLYKLQNIEFNMMPWNRLVSKLQSVEPPFSDFDPHVVDHSLVWAFQNDYKLLP